MAIIDDYAGIAAALRRIQAERVPQEQPQRGKTVAAYVTEERDQDWDDPARVAAYALPRSRAARLDDGLSMTSKPMLQTFVEGELFIHKQLWGIVKRQIARSIESAIGDFDDDLITMVFLYHTLEAYLNYVGQHLDPIFWEDERRHFRATGFAGKIKKVLELCKLSEPDKATRPYKAIWELKTLRDLIAHGKPEAFGESIVHAKSDEPSLWRREILEGLVTHERTCRAVDDISEFIRFVHEAATTRDDDHDFYFARDPLEGAFGYSTASTSCVSN
jgi:hypothetical protein